MITKIKKFKANKNTTVHKSTDRPQPVRFDDFNTPLSPIDRSSRQKTQQRNLRIK
jgi:hypothetical protein